MKHKDIVRLLKEKLDEELDLIAEVGKINCETFVPLYLLNQASYSHRFPIVVMLRAWVSQQRERKRKQRRRRKRKEEVARERRRGAAIPARRRSLLKRKHTLKRRHKLKSLIRRGWRRPVWRYCWLRRDSLMRSSR